MGLLFSAFTEKNAAPESTSSVSVTHSSRRLFFAAISISSPAA
jgi:hypothetical protein